jgi:3-methyladenine DNA glycosylase/8-oxoguanine DNA glycosylase
VIDVRAEVVPAWPFRLARGGTRDGLLRCRDGVLARLVHVDGEPAVVTVRQPARDRVQLAARAPSRRGAARALARMRFALGVDDDLRPFYERFRLDPLLGRAIRARPHLRVFRRPDRFEALAFAICEQLIESERAAAIQRRLVGRWGRRCAESGLRDAPDAARLAGVAPAELQALDLSAGRALALRRAAREVAAGRVDLEAPDHERGWARLRAIPGIGAWTVEMLALHGQGRLDQVPAGDLAFLKLVGRLKTGNPRARASEEEVRELFAAYGPWAGLAGAHLLAAGFRSPARAGIRWSAHRPRSAAA